MHLTGSEIPPGKKNSGRKLNGTGVEYARFWRYMFVGSKSCSLTVALGWIRCFELMTSFVRCIPTWGKRNSSAKLNRPPDVLRSSDGEQADSEHQGTLNLAHADNMKHKAKKKTIAFPRGLFALATRSGHQRINLEFRGGASLQCPSCLP
jgi:hypothetical protein